MKRNIIALLLSGCSLLSSCFELDLNPLAQGSSENWYSSETEIEMALKDYIKSISGRWIVKSGRTIMCTVKPIMQL